MRLLLGIDLGTSYFKVGLFEADGTLRGLARVGVRKSSPHPGWSELAIETFWELLRQGLQSALLEANARPADIAGISYASQANTFLLADAADRPLTPLILWNDTRAAPLEAEVAEFGESPELARTVGFRGLAAEFAAVKCRWFQRMHPAIWERAARVMTLPDYLTMRLTGERFCDGGTAAFTGLFAIEQGGWWPDALDFFGLSATMLATPLSPGSRVGGTGPQANVLGLPSGIPFAVGSIDHHAAAIGAGLEQFGDASISMGTVSAALCVQQSLQIRAECFHGPHVQSRGFFRLAFDADGAARIDDYQRAHAPDLTVPELIALAGQTSGEGKGGHAAAVRRIMEDTARVQRALLGKLGLSRIERGVVATGGGASCEEWLQISADVFGAPVVAAECTESACLGAAVFAAAACGWHDCIGDGIKAMVRVRRRFLPLSIRSIA